MIQAYEGKLAKKKSQGRSGRSGSTGSDQGSIRRGANGYEQTPGDIVMDLFASDSDDDGASGVYYGGQDELVQIKCYSVNSPYQILSLMTCHHFKILGISPH